MISPTADLLSTGQGSCTVESPAPICTTVPCPSPYSQDFFQIKGKDEYSFFSTGLEDFLFGLGLDQYFQSGGTKQRLLRKGLAATIARSEEFDKRVAAVLDHVAISRSQEAIAASIDLLALLGQRVIPIAIQTALATNLQDENVAFVLATVAARQGNWLTRILLKSRHDAVREGALEAVVSRPSLEARPVLYRVAQQDPSAHIRARAKELVEESS